MTLECKAKFDKFYEAKPVITFPILNESKSNGDMLLYDVIPVPRKIVEHIFAQGWKAGKETNDD